MTASAPAIIDPEQSVCCARCAELRQRADALESENAALNSRLETLQGVRGRNSTIARQGREIESLRRENARLKAEVKARRAQHRKVARQAETIEELRRENRELQARLNRANQKRYGRSREGGGRGGSGRKRGAQPGGQGRPRTPRDNLPVVDEPVDRQSAPCCGACGARYAYHGELESEMKEVEVRAYRRCIRRGRWRRCCGCAGQPATRTAAPPAAPLFRGGEYGVSVWVQALLLRHSMQMTLGSVSRWFGSLGMPVSKGTLARHDAKFLQLFRPLHEAIGRHQRRAALAWHVDETSWPVSREDGGWQPKSWCWICATPDSVRFLIDRGRGSAAGLALLDGFDGGHLMCDRYCAYPPIARELNMDLSFCWAHARRDFVDLGKGEKGLKGWADRWTDRIGRLYALNTRRLAHWDADLAFAAQNAAFSAAHRRLAAALDDLFKRAARELARLEEGSPRAGPLARLLKFEAGLRCFEAHPWLEMDNNRAERGLRWMVIVRRLSHGSKNARAAELTACLHSVLETLSLNGVDVRAWLTRYLEACAQARGAPPDPDRWLPFGGWPQAP